MGRALMFTPGWERCCWRYRRSFRQPVERDISSIVSGSVVYWPAEVPDHLEQRNRLGGEKCDTATKKTGAIWTSCSHDPNATRTFSLWRRPRDLGHAVFARLSCVLVLVFDESKEENRLIGFRSSPQTPLGIELAPDHNAFTYHY